MTSEANWLHDKINTLFSEKNNAEKRSDFESTAIAHEMAVAVGKILSVLTVDERNSLFGELSDIYCRHCWYPQPVGRTCQCWNDE